jgi:hypothetical protein
VPSEIRYDHTTQVFRPGTDEPAPPSVTSPATTAFAWWPASPGGHARRNRPSGPSPTSTPRSFGTAKAASLAELNHKLRRWLDEVANARTSEDIVVGDGEKLW